MRLLTINDLKAWSETSNCKFYLSLLVRKLIFETINTKSIKMIRFPYGEDVFEGGLDGELEVDMGNSFVPKGKSVWEFGTTNNKRKKADGDYQKRTTGTSKTISKEITYIAVNGKKYGDRAKKKWLEEKNNERVWKTVKYIDILDIDHWLDTAPMTELWLAKFLGKPTLGIFSGNEYWKIWSEGSVYKIPPEILLGKSRQKEAEIVNSFCFNQQSVLYIKSRTIEEATVFPLAVLCQNKNQPTEIAVIDNRASFNDFIHAKTPLLIIAKFRIDQIDLQGAIQKRHKVIIPLNQSDEINSENKILLPIISRDNFENGLKKMGIDSEQVRILTKSSGRSISVLRRLLKFHDDTKPKYLKQKDYRDLIPMLLINKFSEGSTGDKKVLENLAGVSFDEYIQFLRQLINEEDSPIYHVNGVWRLVSPPDIWLYFGRYINQSDLDKFQKICQEVLSEILYKYKLPKEDRGGIIYNRENSPEYSSYLKEGLCESLNLIAISEEIYGINSIIEGSNYVDGIVNVILNNDLVVWRSLSNNLMLLAEASPNIFLKRLELVIQNNSVRDFFEEEKNFIHATNDLPPLLWSLEIIAWFPEYLLKISKIICELILRLPEKLPTMNTPFNTLKDIFRIWYPQTNATAEDRKKILSVLINQYPKIGFDLLVDLVDWKQDHAGMTPRPKWRLFSELREIRVSQNETDNLVSFCLERLIQMSRDDLGRLSVLIELLDDIPEEYIDKTLQVIEEGRTRYSESDKNTLFHGFRRLISSHRTYPNTDWALPSEIVDKIEKTAFKIKPDLFILNNSYLFEESYPELIEGNLQNFDKQEQKINKRRLDFVEYVIIKNGIDKIFELAKDTEFPQFYGNTLALSNIIDQKDEQLIYKLLDTDNVNLLRLVETFISIKQNKLGLDKMLGRLNELRKPSLSSQGVINFLLSLRSSLALWNYIENINDKDIEKGYWQGQKDFLSTNTKEELDFALNKLFQYGKSITLLNTLGWAAHLHKDTITSDEVLTWLEKVNLEEYDDSSRFMKHNYNILLDFLYGKNDYSIERGAKFEKKFILTFQGAYNRKPKNLYLLMSRDPKEYFSLLCQAYMTEDEARKDKEVKEMKSRTSYLKDAIAAFDIFRSYDKIPGLKEDRSIDGKKLEEWVKEVRELSRAKCKTKEVEHCLGELLAKYPINMKDGDSYPEAIYNLIEEINTKEIKIGFEVQISNNLSFTSRGPYDGGIIEKNRARYFNKLYEETKISHPDVAQIFKNLKDKYLHRARKEDEEAIENSLE